MNTYAFFKRLAVPVLIAGMLMVACNLPGAQQTAEPTAPSTEAPVVTEATDEPPVSTQDPDLVRAKATTRVPIRSLPGPTCPIIGWVEQDQVIALQLRNLTDPTYWYETDYLGQDQPGWIYHEPLSLLNDDGPIPRVKKFGCPEDIVTTPAPPEAAMCSDGWHPLEGCACCGTVLVCSDGITSPGDSQCRPDRPEKTQPPID